MRKDGYALNIEDVDGGDYSDDFEDDDEEMERIRGEWMEQQRRRDVQRQWNIEAAEAVPEEMAGVHTTPQRISSDEDGDASEEDRVCKWCHNVSIKLGSVALIVLLLCRILLLRRSLDQ